MSGPITLKVIKAGAHLDEYQELKLVALDPETESEYLLVPERGRGPKLAWKRAPYLGRRAKVGNTPNKSPELDLWKFDNVFVDLPDHPEPTAHTFVMEIVNRDADGPEYIVITGWNHDDDAGGDHGGGAHAQK